MENGVVRFVTARARCNDAEVWKNHRDGGGILISVRDNEIVSSDLSMPHSPRLQNGDLWLLNTGTCEFGSVDLKTGRIAHRLNFQHTMKEISNVSVIPEVHQVTMLAFSNQEHISGFITLPNA